MSPVDGVESSTWCCRRAAFEVDAVGVGAGEDHGAFGWGGPDDFACFGVKRVLDVFEGAGEDFAVAVGGSDACYAAASDVGAPSHGGCL